MRRGWTDADIGKVAGGNVLRVMTEAERVSASMSRASPVHGTEDTIDHPANAG